VHVGAVGELPQREGGGIGAGDAGADDLNLLLRVGHDARHDETHQGRHHCPPQTHGLAGGADAGTGQDDQAAPAPGWRQRVAAGRMIAGMEHGTRGRPEFAFTPAQRAVIDHVAGAMLVAAGPGTGKTRVIVERIARLIEGGHARPQAILALTFARRAAGEMQVRLAERLGSRAGPVTAGTFHSFCLGLIQTHHAALGYGAPPQVIGRRAQVELVRRVLARLAPEDLDPLAPIATRPFGASLVAEAIGRLTEAAEDAFDQPVRTALEGVARAYHVARRAAGLLDYAAMVPEAVRLLASSPAVANALRQRFPFVIVDEYQDTNRTQEQLLDLLAPPGAHVMAVGDDDQAIYAFRGTTPRNLRAFAGRRDARRVDLTDNWRCGAPIQAAASRVIAHNLDRLPKTTAAGTADGAIEALRYPDLAAHARGLAALIDDAVRVEGRRCGDIAVLWRSLGHPLVDMLLAELGRLDIPARAVRPARGGGLRTAMAALLRMRLDGQGADDEPLTAVLESELGGLSPIHAQRLVRAARRAGQPLAAFIAAAPGDPDARVAAATIRHVRSVLAARAGSLEELFFAIWRTFPSLAEAVRASDDGDAASQARARRLVAHFQAIWSEVSASTHAQPDGSVRDFLEQFDREADEPTELRLEDVGEDVVQLMTVHQAKGLEWPMVLVPALEEGVFPITAGDRGAAGMLGALTRPTPVAASVEEERRLFYVAMTRAQQRLVLSVDAHGREAPAMPSRFLSETEIPLRDAPDASGIEALREAGAAEAWLRRRLRGGTVSERAQAVYALSRLPRHGPPWWSSVEPSTVEPPRVGDAPIDVAATGLVQFRACPYLFKCARLFGLAPLADPARGLGRSVHAALSAFHAPNAAHAHDAATLERLIGEHWDDRDFAYAPIAARYRLDARELIANYLKFHATRGAALAVEQPFGLTIGGLTIRGRIDAVFPTADGVELVDFKTGRRVMSKAEAQRDLQLGVYLLALDRSEDLRHLGTPASAAYLFVGQITPQSKDRGLKARAAGAEERAAVQAKVARYERAIRRWELPPKSAAAASRAGEDADDLESLRDTRACPGCDFRRVCPDWMPVRTGQ